MKKVAALVIFAVMTAALGFGQTTADEWLKKAGAYFESGDYANAVTAYSEAIKRDGSNLNAYWVRGLAYFRTKNYDAAIADCTTVIQRAPDLPTAYMVRGDVYGAKGLYHKAAADYKTGLEKGHDPSGFVVDKSSKADMWFCGAMYMEIAVNRFLGKSDAVTKYENLLKTVCDKNKVTRAEVETFYRQNIGALVASVVDAEFNKVAIPLYRYDAVLTRTTGNQYVLSYKDVNDVVKELPPASLETLLATMRRTTGFEASDIDAVRAQAALIPAVRLDRQSLDDIKVILTSFYTSPNAGTYNATRDVYALFSRKRAETSQQIYEFSRVSYGSTLSVLNTGLAQKVFADVRTQTSITALTTAQQQRLLSISGR